MNESPRICIINDDRFPSRWTNTQQTVKTASALVADGAQIELVLPRLWDSMFFRSNEQRLEQLEHYYGVEAGFALTQIPSVPPSSLRIEKIVHGMIAPIYSIIAGHDVIYSRNIIPLSIALAAGKHVVFESHRILKEHYKPVYAAVKGLMKHPRFLGVVTNAGMIADSFVEMGFDPERVAIAHNCYDPKDMLPKLSKLEARQQLGLDPNAKIVCYTGHIQKTKGIGMIVELAAKTPELAYVICGGYPEDVAAAKLLADQAGAKNLTFTGWIDVHALSPYLYAADVLLIPPTSAPLQKHGNTVMPIKTYTYLAAGRVIVGPKQEDVREVLHDGQNCLLVEPDQLDAAVATVRGAFADRVRMERLGAQAERDSALYTWEARARLIHDFIRSRLAAVGAIRDEQNRPGSAAPIARAP